MLTLEVLAELRRLEAAWIAADDASRYTRRLEYESLLHKHAPALFAAAEALVKIRCLYRSPSWDHNGETMTDIVDAVATAIGATPVCGLLEDDNRAVMARAAIAAVHAHETCARCGRAVKPPTLCNACAQDKTPVVQTERRGR